MKIKTKELPFAEVMAIEKEAHVKPVRQSAFFRWLMYVLSKQELKATCFSYEEIGMEKLGADEPAMYLMNHSSFTDLQIISMLLKKRQYHIVCTNDGLIGKAWLMRKLGCIPTKKFIMDVSLVRDMKYAVSTLNSSIVMYPEASYSFDGTKTPLPDSLGKCLKLLGIPVVMIRTRGAFLRDPLYNCLQKRDTKVSAKVEYLLSPEDIKTKSVDQLNAILNNAFDYNHFREQIEDEVLVNEDFRADGLHRVLYKCPKCKAEGKMRAKGISILCNSCGDSHELLPSGKMKGATDTSFELIPDWYNWQRECVKQEIADNSYNMVLDVDVMMLVDSKCIYKVGEGRLVHDNNGFRLTGMDGELDFTMGRKASYSLYADYFWYEIGDMICIGDADRQYYCFPKDQEGAIVAKARLATEELYKIS